MDLTQKFIEKAKRAPARIVYPEGNDERVLIAAVKVKELGIALPMIIGKADPVKSLAREKGCDLDGIPVIEPEGDDTFKSYVDDYAARRGVDPKIAQKILRRPLAFGGMMVRHGQADGMVAGVATATASVIQAAALTIGYQEGISTPSSFFIMILPEFNGEKDKIFIFADCAVNVQPTAEQLADIAIASGMNAKKLLGIEPKIAFLSFSTKGSAAHSDADKVISAVKIAQEKRPDWAIDGEMQGDAAIVMRVAQKKVKESGVAGQANVLVFPDLDAGNIAYKLVQYMGGATALGPVLQGFAGAVNDMSRGASVDDLIGVTAITAVQAKS